MDKKIEELAAFLKSGSKIHIKKSQRGSFTRYCNGKVTSECIRRGKNSPDPRIRKKATFAANARKWKHDEGGKIDYEPTIDDLIKFTTSFEDFSATPYTLKDSSGNDKVYAGYGSVNKDTIDLATNGKLTKELALSDVKIHYNTIFNELNNRVKGFKNLPIGVKFAIADTAYTTGIDKLITGSPKLMGLIANYNPNMLSSLVKELDHSKNARGWLGVRSSARRAMALGKYDWNWKEFDSKGRQINSTQYKGPEDWKASPYYAKYQKGGGLTYKPFIGKESTYESFIPEIFSDYTPSFPVEPVQTYTPVEQAPVKTPEFEIEQVTAPRDAVVVNTPSVEKVLGNVEYKTSNMDVGNMQELIDLMKDEGISFRITSGHRPGAKTKSGKPSHHDAGNALDITPASGQTWDDLIAQMKKSSRFIEYMKSHGFGILDERGDAMQNRTGATGAHFHIGPDQIARTQFKYLIG